MNTCKIYPIPLYCLDTDHEMPKMTYLFYFNRNLFIYFYVWLIQNSKENILVDAGANVEMSMARGRTKEELTHIQTIDEGLANFGLKTDDITTIIITHLHWDHIGLAHKFKNAKLIVQKDELEFALNPHKAAQHYDKKLFEGLNFKLVEGDIQITDGVRVLLTPGHSAGAQSVAVDTKKGTAVITGFCCVKENFRPIRDDIEMPDMIVPGIHLNILETYDSMLKIKNESDIIIQNHEPIFADIYEISSENKLWV